MPEEKRIVIKNKELHSWMQDRIGGILAARKRRTIATTRGAGLSIVGPIISVVEPSETRLGTLLFAEALAGGATGLMWKMFGPVKAKTDKLNNALNSARKNTEIKSFDTEGRYSFNKFGKTHPYAFVNRAGDIVLVPKSKFQDALYKAQQTFLRHIVPGRRRIKSNY